MTDLNYTRELQTNSSTLVDEAFYNENTDDLYVDLYDSVYLYSGVPADVVDAFESADSAGGFYNDNIKGKFPSTNLGVWFDIDYNEVDVVDDTEDEVLTSDSNTNTVVNVSAPRQFAVGGMITTTEAAQSAEKVAEADKVFSLRPFYGADTLTRVEGNERDYAVSFVVDDGTDVKTHKVKADSLDNAVDQTLAVGAMLDLDFRVKEVTVYFE